MSAMSKTLKALEDSIENQQKKLEQMKARKQLLEARVRAAEKKRERREETRRKILAGAFLLEAAGDQILTMEINGKTLEAFLTRENDRVLFEVKTEE
jgi:predicted  nucleic acid-binding Zn-ribbon protein